MAEWKEAVLLGNTHAPMAHEPMFQFSERIKDSFRFKCLLCLLKTEHIMASKNSPSNLRKHIEKTVRDKQYKALQGKLERLEKLCRALQRERNDLSQKLGALQGPAKDPEEEGTGPPDPQPDEAFSLPANVGMDGEVEGEMECLDPETSRLVQQLQIEESTREHLNDD